MAKKPDKGKEEKKRESWNPEAQFDLATTLEELINEPPFREVSGDTGDSMTAGTRIPLWLHRRVTRLKEMPGSPYDLQSDVLRDALYIGMRVLNMRYRMSQDWDVEAKMASIVDAASTSRRLKRQVKELVDGLDDLWRDGDEEHAAESLTNYIHSAVELESSWYRRKLFSLLKEDKTIQVVAKRCDPKLWETITKEAMR